MKRIYLPLMFFSCLFSVRSQTQITLTFLGKDSTSQNLISLDSVHVKNLTENCDTLLYGPVPVLSLMANWPAGIGEHKINGNGEFILKQNFPNPFRGSTNVNIYRDYGGPLNLVLFDGSGKKLAACQNVLEKGSYSYVISTSAEKVLYMVVYDDRNNRSIKIISTGQGGENNWVQYFGQTPPVEKSSLKIPGNPGFVYYLGNQLMYTAYTSGYHEHSMFDSPASSTTYTFNMVPLTIAVPPAVTTAIVTNITPTTATGGGDVTSDGGATVTARGVCWSISANPTTADNHTTDGSGTGVFVSSLTGLVPNTPYFVRAYATNSEGTSYGNEDGFTTSCSSYASVSVTITPSANPECQGLAVTFTAVPINGGSSPSYEWFVNGTVAGINSPTYNFIPANGDVISCVLTSNAPCVSGNPATSNPVTMTITPALPVSVSIVASANPSCAGQSVTFTATPVNGGTSPLYQWSINGAYAGTNNPVLTYVPVNGDVVTCQLTSNAPCASNNPATSNAITMSTTLTLPVSVTIAASANPSCQGQAVTFTAIPVNGGTSPSYQWIINGMVAATTPTITYVPGNGDVVQCILTSNASCVSNNPATSNAITMSTTLSLPVSVTITASANPSCQGQLVTFTATPVNGGTSPFYHWVKNGVSVGTNNPVFIYLPVNGDLITCTLTSNLPCATGNPATSNTITMSTALTLPVSVTITASANPSCQGQFVTFTAMPVNGGASPVYQWLINGLMFGINSPTFVYMPSTGDFITCILTSNLSCTTGNPATSNAIIMTVNPLPASPAAGINVASGTQIVWNWNAVPGATGYKWNTVNNYATATDMGASTTKTETGLTPGTMYTRYVWAYNPCGASVVTTLSQFLP